MDETTLRVLLEEVRSGALGPDEALRRLRRLPYADLGFARVDHHRALRQGRAEAVYGPGKTPEQCAAIVAELLAEPGGAVLLTRADPSQVDA
ncbi:MAG: 1-(5-phosphoribosyl)-5-amino-4-imidazole-carboxylate carboxylase, partial [Acidimicrobiales bacterium]|nr:1-(5-phosphoribosyl)-5-amino-4-imidazole-carboxylate carboxylase [Acidimicrobiales bacterium]